MNLSILRGIYNMREEILVKIIEFFSAIEHYFVESKCITYL